MFKRGVATLLALLTMAAPMSVLAVDRNGYSVRVNQVGYFPKGKKVATVVSSASNPLKWQLKNSSGQTVCEGETIPNGQDSSSGDSTHTIDFSEYDKTGSQFYLEVEGSNKSMRFNIANDLYSKMRDDAFMYFYLNRSGIEITGQYARPAGHPNDIAQAFNYPSSENAPANAGPSTLDLTGGWYDAGDHGKYVVNGGIALWTMMNQYERSLYVDGTDYEQYKMNWIPESGGKYPDILDEAKWEMDWMLKTQFKTGSKAGMAMHSMHDDTWTGLGTLPHMDGERRIYDPQSTAATLNLAACAAQAARLYEKYDANYAKTCLEAATSAYKAAKANASDYAPNFQNGGGAYSDNYVADEFYWAAAELYTTTGDETYLKDLQASPWYLSMNSQFTTGGDSGLTGCFTWQSTAGLGTITLALGQNHALPETDVETARNKIKKCADSLIKLQESTGYKVPMKKFIWGSNSFIVNEAIVMAYAYDYTYDQKYLDAATLTLDYVLGRNATNYSYVTRYGEGAFENPHHRTFTNHDAPGGWLSGGPNRGCEDDYMKGNGFEGKPEQKCYADVIDAYSCNEVAINWNAPFAWITAFLDEQPTRVISSPTPTPVQSPSPTPTPVQSPSPTPTSSIGQGSLGDINEDGSVDIMDAVALKKHILGIKTVSNMAVADMNRDGSVDIMDAVTLKKTILGTAK